MNNEIKVSGTIPTTIETEGSTTVTAQKFHAIINSIPNGNDAEICLNENNLDVVSGNSHFHLATIPAEDYPVSDNYALLSCF